MKRLIALAMIFAFVVCFTTPVLALPEPVTTLKDNLVDIVKAPLEIPNHAKTEMDAATFKPFGLMGGILKGTVYSVKKLVTGVVNIIAIPVGMVK